jgi:hypothetical protein
MEKVNLRLIIKNDPESDDDFGGTYSIEYENVTYRILSEHMVIEEFNGDGEIIGHIRKIKEIKTYKIWQ